MINKQIGSSCELLSHLDPHTHIYHIYISRGPKSRDYFTHDCCWFGWRELCYRAWIEDIVFMQCNNSNWWCFLFHPRESTYILRHIWLVWLRCLACALYNRACSSLYIGGLTLVLYTLDIGPWGPNFQEPKPIKTTIRCIKGQISKEDGAWLKDCNWRRVMS